MSLIESCRPLPHSKVGVFFPEHNKTKIKEILIKKLIIIDNALAMKFKHN